MKYLIIYLIIINALAMLLMLADKLRARKKLWRIPEATLLGCALLGGSMGALLGMYTVRHKTAHAKFYIGVPILLVVNVLAVCFIIKYIR